MRYARDNVVSLEEVAQEFEMSESLLADLRSHIGESTVFQTGRQLVPKDRFDDGFKSR